jgi:hypothetical protein
MPTPFESATLNLRLFDLRREPVLREARNWFLMEFNPASFAEFVTLVSGDRNASFRMVIGYWEMAASLVTTGAVDADAFRAAHGEIVTTVSKGTVLALEADAGLAERARRNLAGCANVAVRCATEANSADEPFDAIFVNAGATEVHPAWIDQLRNGGRLLAPSTMSSIGPAGSAGHIGGGHMLRVERQGRSYAARFISPVGIFHCIGARTDVGERYSARRCGEETLEWCRVSDVIATNQIPSAGCIVCLFACR